MDAVELMTSRRSPLKLVEPAPDDAALATLLRAANRAPDHGRMKPWRFVVLRDAGRQRLAELMVEALRKRDPAANEGALERERQKPMRAPLIVVVAASVIEGHKIPVVEQIVAAGAATQNIVLAAHALGFGAMWKTGEPAYDPDIKAAMGLKPSDVVVGLLYLGTPAGPGPVIDGPEPPDMVRHWP